VGSFCMQVLEYKIKHFSQDGFEDFGKVSLNRYPRNVSLWEAQRRGALVHVSGGVCGEEHDRATKQTVES
jgi:hypothetical protein